SCIVCPVADSTSMRVLSDEQRTMIFLSRSIWVPKGARCCSNHLYKGHLSYEARQSVKQSKVDDIILNKHNVEKLIANFRLALKHAGSLDFDDPGALENETYTTITGLDRASKRSVSRICHQVRVALMQNFVPYHVGCQHVSREAILAQHQTTVATELLTNGRDQVVLIADGTYFFCQKSSNNDFQRRTYSQHKHRHLGKPMIITASDGYIISSLGPFFTDSLNNDAAILKHCMLNNEQEVLSWLRDNDVLVLDRGFRNTVNTLNRLGLQVAMPGFLHNKKQLPADEANRTRFVTKNRWVIESGKI
ncbi:unnamed protein product, partial [Rotaria socialis]